MTDHLSQSTALMSPIASEGERELISSMDVLAQAQLSGFNNPTLNPYAVAKPSPGITNIAVSGTTLALRGTNGAPDSPYVLLSSTNVALPLAQWTPVVTNLFDGAGNFSVTTSVVNPGAAQQFYIVKQTPLP